MENEKDKPTNCTECEYLLRKEGCLFCHHPKGYFYLSDNYPEIPISCPLYHENK